MKVLRLGIILNKLFFIRKWHLIAITNFLKNNTVRKKSIELTINVLIIILLKVWNWFLIFMFFLLFLFYCLKFIFSYYLIWNNFIILIILTWSDLLIFKIITLSVFKFIKLLAFFEFTIKIEGRICILLFFWCIIQSLLSIKFILIIYFHPVVLIVSIKLIWRNELVLFAIFIFLLRRSKVKIFILIIFELVLI